MKTPLCFLCIVVIIHTSPAQHIDWTLVHQTTMHGLDHLYNLKIHEGLADFDSVARMAPGDPRGPFFQSMVHFYLYGLTLDQKELDLFLAGSDRVIDICEGLLDQNEHDATTKFYLGGIYGYRGLAFQATGSLLKAVRDGRKGYKYLEDAVREDPGLYDAHMGFGLYRYLVAKVPRSMGTILSLLGFGGDLEGGLQDLRLAAERGVYTRTEARLFLAQFLFNEGRQDTAVQYLSDLCDQYPGNTLFVVLLASWHNRLGNLDKAFSAAIRAMDLNRRNTLRYGEELVYSTLGSVYFSQNMFDSSMVYYRRSMTMTTNDERTPNITMLRAGEACEIAGDRAAALDYYRRMREPGDGAWDFRTYRRGQELIRRPMNAADILLIRAGNESVQKHYGRSIALYGEAEKEAGATADQHLLALYGLQQSQFDSTLYADALETSTKLLSLTPQEETWILPHGCFRLGLIYEKLGRTADARNAFENVTHFDDYESQDRLEAQVKAELARLDTTGRRAEDEKRNGP